MAVMVDLEEVKNVIRKLYYGTGSIFVPANIMPALDELAYGKIYTCWYCGDKIYAGEHGWYHVNGGAKECIKSSGSWVPEYRATPKPKDMED